MCLPSSEPRFVRCPPCRKHRWRRAMCTGSRTLFIRSWRLQCLTNGVSVSRKVSGQRVVLARRHQGTPGVRCADPFVVYWNNEMQVDGLLHRRGMKTIVQTLHRRSTQVGVDQGRYRLSSCMGHHVAEVLILFPEYDSRRQVPLRHE